MARNCMPDWYRSGFGGPTKDHFSANGHHILFESHDDVHRIIFVNATWVSSMIPDSETLIVRPMPCIISLSFSSRFT
jgi:hypothetical protein